MTTSEQKTGSESSVNEVHSPLEKKARISQPPYLPLGEAVRIAEQIYEQGGGSADSTLLTKLLNNSNSSSSFARKLQAIRGYRLISSAAPPVTLTDIALSIVAPKDEAARLVNIKLAAIGPEPFRRTYERLKGKLLPQDEYLGNSFAHEMQLPKVVADAWVDSLKSALEFAGLLLARPDGKTQVLEGASLTPGEAEAKVVEEVKADPASNRVETESTKDRTAGSVGEGHSTKIALADGRVATIFIPDRLTQRDATRLKGALGGIAAIIDSMVEETP